MQSLSPKGHLFETRISQKCALHTDLDAKSFVVTRIPADVVWKFIDRGASSGVDLIIGSRLRELRDASESSTSIASNSDANLTKRNQTLDYLPSISNPLL
ncbi:hypothetical protein AVEN_155091-1 [Araneus ventricosus]|uniref:Uncharacterized protein n=1 Tax=Araneus ventricosus TaxID=182803 RepID=A0A4Y2A7K4_ARAVE|nr:hypothetical protein AVEN_155091-1 [Araneus ventricosus]